MREIGFGFPLALIALLLAMWLASRMGRSRTSRSDQSRGPTLLAIYVFGFLIFALPSFVTGIALGGLCFLGISEFLKALGRQATRSVVENQVHAGVLAALAAWPAFSSWLFLPQWADAVLWLAALVYGLVRMGGWSLAVLLIALGFRMTAMTRDLASGAEYCLFVFFLTNVSDSVAYLTGKLIGKRPLAPRISPGKTVEGSIGGLVATIPVGFLFGYLLGLELSVAATLLLVLTIGVAAQLGDLLASVAKRRLAIKDFGTILPGHGGVLDRLDSALIAFPSFLVIWNIAAG